MIQATYLPILLEGKMFSKKCHLTTQMHLDIFSPLAIFLSLNSGHNPLLDDNSYSEKPQHKPFSISELWWCMPIILIFWEAEEGGLQI